MWKAGNQETEAWELEVTESVEKQAWAREARELGRSGNQRGRAVLCVASAGLVAVVKFVEILQGKWLGHSLHAAVVHVPVGGWVTACALDVAVWKGWVDPTWSRVAAWCVGIGLAVVLLAVPTGIAEWSAIKREKPAWKLALAHFLLNLGAIALWGVNFWLRIEESPVLATEPVTDAILGTSVVATMVVIVSGYLGALMVFDHGIGVGRHSKKKWRKIAADGGARLPEEK